MPSTLVLIKPDAVSKKHTEAIMNRFIQSGLVIKRQRCLQPSIGRAMEHYLEHVDKPFYPGLCRFLCSGPVVALELQGDEQVVATVRKMLGAVGQPGTLRGDFGTSTQENAVHASDSNKSAESEIALWFPSPCSGIEELITLFEKYGTQDYIGEQVSQLSHAVQTARLARAHSPQNVPLIAAALLHDIGQLVGMRDEMSKTEWGVLGHEQIGANYLCHLGFPNSVCQLVRNHVLAKRYLATVEPDYPLSAASRATLIEQKGLLSPEEIATFQRDPVFADSVMLRRWDDQAKEPLQLGLKDTMEFWDLLFGFDW